MSLPSQHPPKTAILRKDLAVGPTTADLTILAILFWQCLSLPQVIRFRSHLDPQFPVFYSHGGLSTVPQLRLFPSAPPQRWVMPHVLRDLYGVCLR